jgi:uncharacterized membrane protein
VLAAILYSLLKDVCLVCISSWLVNFCIFYVAIKNLNTTPIASKEKS